MLTSFSKMFLLHQIFRILASEQDEVLPIFFLSPIFQILASQQEKILPILPKIYFLQSVSDHSSNFGFPLRNVADPLGWVVKPHMATTKARILWGGWWNPKRRLGHLVTTIRVNGLHVFAWTEWMSEAFAHDGQVQRCFFPKNFLRQFDSSTIGFITGWHAAHFSQEVFDFIRFFQHGENADQFFQDVFTSSDFSHFGFWAGRSAAHFFFLRFFIFWLHNRKKYCPFSPRFIFPIRFRSFFEFWISTKECCRSLGVGGETPYGNY